MVLTRFGNKRKLAAKLYKLFPDHRMRIELFFGAGGSFFYMPKPKFSILNDLDDDVTNLYLVILHQKEELKEMVRMLPLSETLIKYWKANRETEPLIKAIRFLFLSNFTYLGKGDTLRVGLDRAKMQLLKNIDPTFEHLDNAKILNRDFRDVLSKISFTKGLNDKEKAFMYLDPIYLGTEHTYRVPGWGEKDVEDCLDIMTTCGIKSAMSEFNHPFVLEQAKNRGLNIITVGERANIKNRRTEILITNYDNLQQTLIFNE